MNSIIPEDEAHPAYKNEKPEEVKQETKTSDKKVESDSKAKNEEEQKAKKKRAEE